MLGSAEIWIRRRWRWIIGCGIVAVATAGATSSGWPLSSLMVAQISGLVAFAIAAVVALTRIPTQVQSLPNPMAPLIALFALAGAWWWYFPLVSWPPAWSVMAVAVLSSIAVIGMFVRFALSCARYVSGAATSVEARFLSFHRRRPASHVSESADHRIEGHVCIICLANAEYEFVARTFFDHIDRNRRLHRISRTGDVVSVEELEDAFQFIKWPGKDTSAIELAWKAVSLNDANCESLRTYSVFWMMADDGPKVWINKTASGRPESHYCLGLQQLLELLWPMYGLYLSVTTRDEHKRETVRHRLRISGLWLTIPILFVSLIFTPLALAGSIDEWTFFIVSGYGFWIWAISYITSKFDPFVVGLSIFLCLVTGSIALISLVQKEFLDSGFYVMEVYIAMLIALYPTYLRHIKYTDLTAREERRVWRARSWGLIVTFSKSSIFVLAAYFAAKYVVNEYTRTNMAETMGIAPVVVVVVLVVVTVFDFLKSEGRGPEH